MDFRHYYERELEHLFEAGRTFGQVHRQASHLAQRSGDPDVERLLEGFAFLSAKTHARLDAGQPALVQQLCQLIAPHLLYPTPSCTMVEFRSDPLRGPERCKIPLGTEVLSRDISGIPLRFRCTQELCVLPIAIQDIELQSRGAQRSNLTLTLQCSPVGSVRLQEQGFLDLFLHGEPSITAKLMFTLARHSEHLRIYHQQDPTNTLLELTSPRIELLGFAESNPLLPHAQGAWRGTGLCTEYFTLPEKFRQLRVHGLDAMQAQGGLTTLCLSFELKRDANELHPVHRDMIRLHCTPAINLFECDAEPIKQRALDRPSRIRAASLEPDQFELYDVKTATLAPFAQDARITIAPRRAPGLVEDTLQYVVQRRNNAQDHHLDAFLRIVARGATPAAPRDLVTLELWGTHRNLPNELGIDDIQRSRHPIPSHLKVSNLTVPTQACPPQLQGDLQQRLFSLLSGQSSTHPSLARLGQILELCDPQTNRDTAPGRRNTQLRAVLRALSHHNTTCLVQGAPVRGRHSILDVDERGLDPGEIFLFGQLIDELLADSVGLNGIQQTQLRLRSSQQELHWPPRSGMTVFS